MGMGVVSSEEFDAVVHSLSESVVKRVTGDVVSLVPKGRGNKKEVPQVIRKIVAEESIKGAPASDLSEIFNVSHSSISAYKNDATSTSTYDKPDEGLLGSNNQVRSELAAAARTRLSKAIENITDEKLADAKLRDIASVARDMSAVIKNMEPERDSDGPHPQFIFFAPKQRTEQEYIEIQVSE